MRPPPWAEPKSRSPVRFACNPTCLQNRAGPIWHGTFAVVWTGYYCVGFQVVMDYHRVRQLSVNNLWHTIKPSLSHWHILNPHHPLAHEVAAVRPFVTRVDTILWCGTRTGREAAGTLKDNGSPLLINSSTNTPVLTDQGSRQRPKHHPYSVRCSCPCICPHRGCNCNWSLFEPSKSELVDFELQATTCCRLI